MVKEEGNAAQDFLEKTDHEMDDDDVIVLSPKVEDRVSEVADDDFAVPNDSFRDVRSGDDDVVIISAKCNNSLVQECVTITEDAAADKVAKKDDEVVIIPAPHKESPAKDCVEVTEDATSAKVAKVYCEVEPNCTRQLYVGGLSPDTTENSLRAYFEKWGELTYCKVLLNPVTQRPRGYGFIMYPRSYMLEAVQRARPHTLDGKVVDTRRAMPRHEPRASRAAVKKLFVGGIGGSIGEKALIDYFKQYGNVISCNIVPRRSYAFIEFDDTDPVDKICSHQAHVLNNQLLRVARAFPSQNTAGQSTQRMGYFRGSGYNRGGNWSTEASCGSGSGVPPLASNFLPRSWGRPRPYGAWPQLPYSENQSASRHLGQGYWF